MRIIAIIAQGADGKSRFPVPKRPHEATQNSGLVNHISACWEAGRFDAAYNGLSYGGIVES